ncbi:P-loop containing nucleoside triphosphate hydrolase protein [Kalaharituber pfeilii]|nr:P-loop containing nucleoside triphosphate hydrolase protein [Kalaharituber pfeilii]
MKSLNLSFDIPFSFPDVRRNSDFVGREDLLEQLNWEIEEGAATMDIIQVVLYGMGGIGKTQLALEYIHRHCKDYSSVFWINAASEQTTRISFSHIMQRLVKHHATLSDSDSEPDYSHIGRLLGMAGKLDQAGKFTVQQPSEEQHVVDAVKEWLITKNNTKWLLVIDNLDDIESFDINDYIPSAPHGTVIITSRRPESTQGRRGLEVQQMDNSEAEELLFKSAKRDFEKIPLDAAATIVHKLGYLPLAIEQAGAYIHVRQYSFSRYLKEYNTNVTHLLSKKWKVGKHDRSVFAAWDLSFNAIQSQNPKAAGLLLLCGFFDNNDICEELLRRGMKLPMNDTSLGNSIHTLFSYSMAKRKDSDDSFSIHPLVHMWSQWKLEMEPERYTKKAIEALLVVASAIAIPASRRCEVEDWVFERRILPHIFVVERHMKSLEMENTQILTAVDNLCLVYKNHGYFRKAEEMYNIVLAAREKLLGPNHPDTLSTVYHMAVVHRRQGQYNKALECYERALAGEEKVLGADHPSTLETVTSMGVVFDYQGQYNKALELYERALAGTEKALGADHPSTLITVNNMALVFYKQGQYNKALELLEQVLARRKKTMGADHPSTLDTVNNMALVFSEQGQYNKALELLEQVLAGREKTMGVDHPNTLDALNNMGMVFYKQGQHKKSLELFERALAGYEKALGADHPSTLGTIRNMANLLEASGQSDKARELRERASGGSSANAGT